MLPPTELDPEAFAAQAAEDRRSIVLNSESHAWHHIALEPWNIGRQRLYIRIAALDVPGGDLEDLPPMKKDFDEKKAAKRAELQALEAAAQVGGKVEKLREVLRFTFDQLVDYDLYLPSAIKVLYLAAVPQASWFHLRAHPARLLAAIEAWGEENIPLQEAAAACDLAARILTEHRALIPQIRIQGGDSQPSGN